MLALFAVLAAAAHWNETGVRAGQDTFSANREAAPLEPEASVVTFSNTGNININDSAAPPTPATPYPSTITVSGMPPSMSNLRVVINGLTHTFPDDIDIVLVGPQGQRSILMSDAGGSGDVTLLPPIGFEQSAATTLPDSTTLTAGLFKPTNYADAPNDAFPAPGPTVAVNEPANLSVFDGTNPNGDWKLFVVDDANVDGGFIANGWSIRFTVPLLTVTKTADTNDGVCDADCSLREAIAAASPGEYINFSSLFNSPQTITLNGNELFINKDLIILGPGANVLTVSGNNASRVLSVASGASVIVGGMKISGGNDPTGEGGGIRNNGILGLNAVTVSSNTSAHSGGGVYNHGGGTLAINDSTITANLANIAGGGLYGGGVLTLSNSTIAGNSAIFGGGVYAGFNGATMTNSTISGNSASNQGGGINADIGTLEIDGCTITDNTAGSAGKGSGFHQNAGTVSTQNTIIGANRENTTRPDVVVTGGTLTSAGYNLVGNRGAVTVFNSPGDQSGNGASPLNPRLAPLANNGGLTLTHALRAGSPALDKGASFFSVSDQRGLLRPVDLPGISNQADGADIGAFEAQSAPTARAPFDYDGDGKTDISIFRPSNGQWWLNRSAAGLIVHTFGVSTDRITPADFTGDGKTDVAIFRPSSGEWFVLRSEDSTFYSFPFGTNGDVPVPGDFDGDGKADATVFRNGIWYIQQSTGGTRVEGFGAASGDFPVVADYDGDGRSDLAIYRTALGQWWLNRSTAGLIVHTFGNSADRPVPGDFTGDGKADVAIWRSSSGEWFILRSEDSSFYSFPFGTNGDVAAPGDYDGNGIIDATVFRPSNTTWYSNTQTQGTLTNGFGAGTDRPTPNAYVP